MSANQELIMTADQIDCLAFQAAIMQDHMEAVDLPLELEINVPRMLFAAVGPQNARVVTERMVQIRKDPEELAIAKEATRRVFGD